MTDHLFENPTRACDAAGQALVERVDALTDADPARSEAAVEAVNPVTDIVPVGEYTCVSHALTDADVWIYSLLLFPNETHTTVASDYSLWPGEFDDFDEESKVKAVAHNIANAAVDAYVHHSRVDDIDVAPPSTSTHGKDDHPFEKLFSEEDDLTALVNRVTVDEDEFRHVLVGAREVMTATGVPPRTD